jgi:hypothetical protein
MATGLSLPLIAAGAIIVYALDASIAGPVNVDVIGVILMIVGGIGLLFSLLGLAAIGQGEGYHGHV